MDFKGKNIVISGGSNGIGLGACKELLTYNISSLTILDIHENPEQINELREIADGLSINILFLKTDVTNKKNVEKSFEKIIEIFKYIDIVICNAGIAQDQNMELTMNVNFFGVVYITLTAMNFMSKSCGGKGGIIMATSSVAGLMPHFPLPCYTASKHAIIGFYRSLSDNFYFNKHNIKFILICPGKTETKMLENVADGLWDPETEHLLLELLQNTPTQNADTMGKLIVDVLKIGENGSAWIADGGKIIPIEFKHYWP